jgi:hypothetical protein
MREYGDHGYGDCDHHTREQTAWRILCIQATSAPSERMFSSAGNIITKKRASLEPDISSDLIFLDEIAW